MEELNVLREVQELVNAMPEAEVEPQGIPPDSRYQVSGQQSPGTGNNLGTVAVQYFYQDVSHNIVSIVYDRANRVKAQYFRPGGTLIGDFVISNVTVDDFLEEYYDVLDGKGMHHNDKEELIGQVRGEGVVHTQDYGVYIQDLKEELIEIIERLRQEYRSRRT